MKRALAACAAAILAMATSAAETAVTAGNIVVEPPTLHCLGFEWPISGDANRNATVSVRYRLQSAAEWRPAQPLLRLGGEKAGMAEFGNEMKVPPMFAGSIFALEPGTAYEVQLSLTDADGGDREEVLVARTKPMPMVSTDGRQLHVYPQGFAGTRSQPAFTALQAAFDAAAPGDRVLLHAGEYTGHYVLARSGTLKRPIVIQGAGDGPAVLIGDQHREMFDIHAADYLWFEDLTFRDPGTGDGGHTIDGVVLLAGNASHDVTPGCRGLVVRHCRFEDFGVGIMAADAACRDFTITDNFFLGRQNWTGPKEDRTDRNYRDHSYVAVWVAGAGHDVAYNYVRGFRDGINVVAGWAEKGPPPADQRNVSIDFYNNEITEMGDDFIETEPGSHNIRVYRNRCTNTQTCGISAQPVYGGPVYLIRNTLYNLPRKIPLKFNVHPAGLLVYHNTFVSDWHNAIGWSNGHFRNNIFMGTLKTATLTDYSTMDYDALMAGVLSFGAPRLGWENRDAWQLRGNTYDSLTELQAASGMEQHGVIVDFDVFAALQPAAGLTQTDDPQTVNLALNPRGLAVDAGQVLANINDQFLGAAPDLGALEAGAPLPHYGPRDQ